MDSQNRPRHEQDFPAVIKNKITGWKILNFTKKDWCDLFKDKPLKFRQGRKTFTATPYWEQLCESREMTLNEFFEISNADADHWLYFDYKYLRDVFPDNEFFVNEIKWSDIYLFDVDKEETALWIGNEGAHTPCHKDTYGYNLVAQLFGRKLWILIPPEESERLQAVRVPYEESSVYSDYNFYTPNENLLNIQKAYKVVLSPGDVLYVPRHWWHYVENLEPAISINTWLPLVEDHESRLEESLVQHYVSSICRDLSEEECKQILNPNEYALISEPCTLSTVDKCLEIYKKHKEECSDNVRSRFSGEMTRLGKLDVESYVKEKCTSHKYSLSDMQKPGTMASNKVSIAKALINAYCQMSNVTALKNALLKG